MFRVQKRASKSCQFGKLAIVLKFQEEEGDRNEEEKEAKNGHLLKKEDFRDSEVSRKKERDPKNDKKGDKGKQSL